MLVTAPSFALCFLVMLSVPYLSAQSVSNVRASQTEDDQIIVSYDLHGKGYRIFSINLLLSRDGGRSFTIRPRTVRGDVGEDILPGRDKEIIWDVLMDVPRLKGENFVFRVTATSKRDAVSKDAQGIEWVFVKGGTFEMGDQFGDGDDDEKPVHLVTVWDFCMSRYEVTNAQFCAFLNAKGNQEEGGAAWLDISDEDCLIEKRNGRFAPKRGYAAHPVVEVTWYGARAFCRWLSEMTGAAVRLPTEAEWEYAARAGGKKLEYPHGNRITHDDANYDGTGGRDHWQRTSPVGSFPPNAMGLFDMAGNVWEWCSDWYDADYYRRSPQINPQGPSKGKYRVLRGGSGDNFPNLLRCANRNRDDPDGWYDYVGFRCVRNAN